MLHGRRIALMFEYVKWDVSRILCRLDFSAEAAIVCRPETPGEVEQRRRRSELGETIDHSGPR